MKEHIELFSYIIHRYGCIVCFIYSCICVCMCAWMYVGRYACMLTGLTERRQYGSQTETGCTNHVCMYVCMNLCMDVSMYVSRCMYICVQLHDIESKHTHSIICIHVYIYIIIHIFKLYVNMYMYVHRLLHSLLY